MNRFIGPNKDGKFHCGLCKTWKEKGEMKERINGKHGVEGKCMECERSLQKKYYEKRKLRDMSDSEFVAMMQPRMGRARTAFSLEGVE